MVSARIKKMRDTIMSLEQINLIIPHESIAYAPDPHESPVLRHAKAVEALFKGVSINHIPGERIAGNNTTKYSPAPTT